MGSITTVNPKGTTQDAPLEKLLTYLRTRKIMSFVHQKVVLDFGCGNHLRTLRAIGHKIKLGYGYDIIFRGLKPQKTSDGLIIAGNLGDILDPIDVIVALACFEHLEVDDLVQSLEELGKISSPHTTLVGTVPTPMSEPVLNFLSTTLPLIDRSQIEDHKVYYSRDYLKKVVNRGGWELKSYHLFQFGFNSFFRLEKI